MLRVWFCYTTCYDDINKTLIYHGELLTWGGGRKEPGSPGDGVALDLITSGKLLSVRGREDGDRHAVSPSPGVSPGPGHQQQVVRLRLLLT